MAECFIRKSQVDWEAGVIRYIGKRGRPGTTPITARVARIMRRCWAGDEEWVFTHVARRHGGKAGRAIVIGQRYPVRYQGLKSAFRRACDRLGLDDVTFHRQRHTRGIELGRAAGLKAARDLLNHRSITTTERHYSAAIDADKHAAAEAADAAFAAESPAKNPDIYRKARIRG
jgi:integrase